MKTIITGMNGTVAPFVADAMRRLGFVVTAWDRSSVPTDDETAIRAFIAAEKPTHFFHIATGSPDWAAMAARACTDFGSKFLFTSSVSVYSWQQKGPFAVTDVPQPDDDYGRYKLECEEKVRAANPDALIVRLGWQIGRTHTKNHMLAHLHNQFETNGVIKASTNWYPACSFLWDSADALAHLIQHHPAGLYHLDSNDGLTFYEIVQSLNQLFDQSWRVVANAEHVQNNRMLDGRFPLKTLSDAFGSRHSQ